MVASNVWGPGWMDASMDRCTLLQWPMTNNNGWSWRTGVAPTAAVEEKISSRKNGMQYGDHNTYALQKGQKIYKTTEKPRPRTIGSHWQRCWNADGKKKITKNHETLYKQRTCNSLLPSIDASLDWSPLTKMNESMKGGKEKRRKILKTEEPFGVATWCGGEAC